MKARVCSCMAGAAASARRRSCWRRRSVQRSSRRLPGSKEKCDACLMLGANVAINYKTSDFVEEIRKATNGRGVDVVLDIVGGDYIARDIDALAPDGRVVCIATPRGRTAEINLGALMQKRAAVWRRRCGRAPSSKNMPLRHGSARGLAQLPARDPIRPVVDSTFPLEDAAAAHRRLEESAHVGKIVLVI